MAKIKCPKCGEVFSVDEKEYADILMQIKNEEFNKELEVREKLLREQSKNNESLIKEQLHNQHIQELNGCHNSRHQSRRHPSQHFNPLSPCSERR